MAKVRSKFSTSFLDHPLRRGKGGSFRHGTPVSVSERKDFEPVAVLPRDMHSSDYFSGLPVQMFNDVIPSDPPPPYTPTPSGPSESTVLPRYSSTTNMQKTLRNDSTRTARTTVKASRNHAWATSRIPASSHSTGGSDLALIAASVAWAAHQAKNSNTSIPQRRETKPQPPPRTGAPKSQTVPVTKTHARFPPPKQTVHRQTQFPLHFSHTGIHI